MRVLLVNQLAGRVGGAEEHLHDLIPGLQELGHTVGFLHAEAPPLRDGPGPLPVAPAGLASWSIAAAGGGVVEPVLAWQPDLVYAHRLVDPRVLGPLIARLPSVFFLHGYFGVCISSARCHKRPRPRPCTRKFGWACLGLYFPLRCGGRNPWTLWRDFRRQRAEQEFLHRFNLRLTHSEHVRDEYVRHGLPPDRTRCVPFFVAEQPRQPARAGLRDGAPLRLLFLGRFDVLKGGQLLLRALPAIARHTGRAVHLTLGGDGPARADWQALAGRLASPPTGTVTVEFPGWLTGPAKQQAYAQADLLVVPSVWPEPFGMTGLEAGFHGLPAVAFEVGGVRAWLRPGVNGRIAPGDPPTADGLAAAIAAAVTNGDDYAKLSAGAGQVAGEFTRARHLAALEREFEEARHHHATLRTR